MTAKALGYKTSEYANLCVEEGGEGVENYYKYIQYYYAVIFSSNLSIVIPKVT
jgi:hypothetical protein